MSGVLCFGMLIPSRDGTWENLNFNQIYVWEHSIKVVIFLFYIFLEFTCFTLPFIVKRKWEKRKYKKRNIKNTVILELIDYFLNKCGAYASAHYKYIKIKDNTKYWGAMTWLSRTTQKYNNQP
jgi:hypothetical protein